MKNVWWQVLKLTKKGHLILWDGPHLSCEKSKTILKERQKDYPREQFFRYRVDR